MQSGSVSLADDEDRSGWCSASLPCVCPRAVPSCNLWPASVRSSPMYVGEFSDLHISHTSALDVS